MSALGQYHCDYEHNNWFYTMGTDNDPLPFWQLPREQQDEWMLKYSAEKGRKGSGRGYSNRRQPDPYRSNNTDQDYWNQSTWNTSSSSSSWQGNRWY